jgi:hypothetical protein
MTDQPRRRLDAWLPAAVIIAGSLVFLGGGSRHPRVNADTMPTGGTEEYLRHFGDMILGMPNWELFHTLILIGPLLWAIGAAASRRLLPSRAAVLGDLGIGALMIGGGLWGLAFVLDGLVAPRYAQAIAAAGVGGDAAAITNFGNNAFTMARIGTVSFVLIAASIVALGAALLVDVRVRSWRAFVGAAGVLVGAWPLVLALRGEFYPGPFTSTSWTAMAVSVGLWFALFGTTLRGLTTAQPAVSADSLGVPTRSRRTPDHLP